MEEDRRQEALLTLERKAKRRKAEAALAEMRERAEKNELVIRRNANGVGVLTRSRVLRSAKLKLSGKSSQCSDAKEIDSKTEHLRSHIEDLESKITIEQSSQVQKKEEEYSRLQEKFKNLQETFEQLKRKEKEAKVEKKIKVLKDKYAALQQKIRNMKKSCAENETFKESEKVFDRKSESSVSKKKLESSSSGKGNISKRRKCG